MKLTTEQLMLKEWFTTKWPDYKIKYPDGGMSEGKKYVEAIHTDKIVISLFWDGSVNVVICFDDGYKRNAYERNCVSFSEVVQYIEENLGE